MLQVSLGSKTILSNVEIQENVTIPSGFLYHTVPILDDGERKHVTIAFHVTDDMKFSADTCRAENLQFGGRYYRDFSQMLNVIKMPKKTFDRYQASNEFCRQMKYYQSKACSGN